MIKAHLVVAHCHLIASILYGLIGSCSLHKSRWLKQERSIASRFRSNNDSYACRDLNLLFATASRKSQIQYMYFHVYWEIANFVICYGFLTLRGKICDGLLQICDLCL
jgi:hypothetical protein